MSIRIDGTNTTANPGITGADADTGLQFGTDEVSVVTGGTERVKVDSSGQVGIGTSSLNNLLTLNSNTANTAITIQSSDSGDAAVVFGDQTDFSRGRIKYENSTDALAFETNNLQERMRIDSSGRLLVGTTSALTNVQLFGTSYTPQLQLQGTNQTNSFASITRADGVSAARLFLNSGSAGNTPSSGASIGGVAFTGFDGTNYVHAANIQANIDGTPGAGDMPGRLVFSTTADGASSSTERMRINRTGTFNQSTNISDSDRYGNVNQNIVHSDLDNNVAFLIEHSGANPYGLLIDFSDVSPDNNTKYFISCTDSTTNRLIVWSDGDVDNHDNSYSGISDAKLKQDIVDAASQWDDIKNLRVRKFKFKSDVAEYGDEAKTLIGVVAQETELVSPGLVKESPDLDDDGNDLGTTTKSVRYSVLYMKAIKALQEAQARIETLETQHADLLARVAALEAN